MDKLTGTIVLKQNISGTVVQKSGVTGSVVQKSGITGYLGYPELIHDALPYFDGAYIVTPKVSSQTLQTKSKSMDDDIQVQAIPYAEVSNPSGGKTVTIGFE